MGSIPKDSVDNLEKPQAVTNTPMILILVFVGIGSLGCIVVVSVVKG